MTVTELIEFLQTIPQDAKVMIPKYREPGFMELKKEHTFWMGVSEANGKPGIYYRDPHASGALVIG